MPGNPETTSWLEDTNMHRESWSDPEAKGETSEPESPGSIGSFMSVPSDGTVSSDPPSDVFTEGGTKQEIGSEITLSDCRVGHFFFLTKGDTEKQIALAAKSGIRTGQLKHPVLVVGVTPNGLVRLHPNTSLGGETPRKAFRTNPRKWPLFFPVSPKPANEDSDIGLLHFAGKEMPEGTYINFGKEEKVYPEMLATIGHTRVGEYRLTLESINRIRAYNGEQPLLEDPYVCRSLQAASWRRFPTIDIPGPSAATEAPEASLSSAVTSDQAASQIEGTLAGRPQRDIFAFSNWRSSGPSSTPNSPPSKGSVNLRKSVSPSGSGSSRSSSSRETEIGGAFECLGRERFIIETRDVKNSPWTGTTGRSIRTPDSSTSLASSKGHKSKSWTGVHQVVYTRPQWKDKLTKVGAPAGTPKSVLLKLQGEGALERRIGPQAIPRIVRVNARTPTQRGRQISSLPMLEKLLALAGVNLEEYIANPKILKKKEHAIEGDKAMAMILLALEDRPLRMETTESPVKATQAFLATVQA
ncbi:hypothetical protein MMC13_005069 [Lambiella insularis]|nr:hypothetical protein [Lambiella insularis]